MRSLLRSILTLLLIHLPLLLWLQEHLLDLLILVRDLHSQDWASVVGDMIELWVLPPVVAALVER